jgi:hypothetical protein
MAASPAGIGSALTEPLVNDEEARALSMFENLPTEVIQQVTSYLTRRDDTLHYNY